MEQASNTGIPGEPTDEAILLEAYKSGDRHIIEGLRAVFGKTCVGPKCGVCKWTNCGCINVGNQGGPEWVCHGCLKREHDEVKKLRELGELTIKTVEQKSNNRGWKGLKLWERKLLACAYYALGRKAPH